jgi:hypothetical protein
MHLLPPRYQKDSRQCYGLALPLFGGWYKVASLAFFLLLLHSGGSFTKRWRRQLHDLFGNVRRVLHVCCCASSVRYQNPNVTFAMWSWAQRRLSTKINHCTRSHGFWKAKHEMASTMSSFWFLPPTTKFISRFQGFFLSDTHTLQNIKKRNSERTWGTQN